MKIKIGNKIKMKQGIEGICTGILTRETGREYQISYLVDNEIKCSWIYKCEILDSSEEEKFGFTGD